MKTEIVRLSKKNWEKVAAKAAEIIRRGGLVVFPTETVYGLGASVFDERAVKKIFKAKGRPSDNPIIVHIARFSQLKELAEKISGIDKKLIKRFWPGPLTLIFKKRKRVSSIITGGLPSIAVRMPTHPFARNLIRKAGVPIAAPSANISGRPSGTLGRHLRQDLSGRVDLIIDAGPSSVGLESTVIKTEGGKIFILRPGAVTKEILEKASKLPVFFAKDKKKLQVSPGTKYRHYAPKAKLEIFESEKELKKTLQTFKKRKKKAKVLRYKNLKLMSKNLYRDLRSLDQRGAQIILVKAVSKAGLGVAIMDRLERAARDTI
ncbi:MAG: L-threonylcarbamoyladenylate synthase [Patescibacteria group bacterium]